MPTPLAAAPESKHHMNTEKEAARIAALLEEQNYIGDDTIVTSLLIAEQLRKPLLVEGPAGVGKTEIAKVLARALDTDLIRLQCYEGLDASTALYEWDYKRQLLHIRLSEQESSSLAERERELFDERYLLKRPLLQAITQQQRSPVLLVDELDRADEEFEAFLLEVLSDWQISIPELGTVSASHVPYVVVTSNRTRELSDAVRRRCLYLWIDYPDYAKELTIVRRRVPGIDAALADQICRFVAAARTQPLQKVPGIAETLDWAATLVALHRDCLDDEVVAATLGVVFKSHDDVTHVRRQTRQMLASLAPG